MKIGTFLIGLGMGAALLEGCKKKEDSEAGDATPTAATSMATATAAPTPTPIPVPTPTVAPKPVSNDGDSAAIRACCASMRRLADSEANPSNKAKLNMAAGSCDAQVDRVRTGVVSRSGALSSIRANNGGKPLPSNCN